MLMVLSIPTEYRRELRYESSVSGKSISQIVREIFASHFPAKEKFSETDPLERMFSLSKTMPHSRTHEKWSREEIYNRG